MDNATFNFGLNTVFDVVISCFGFFFSTLGVATGALLTLAILSAIVRLIIKPILGYKLDSLNVGSNLRRGDANARREKMREQRKR